jgi:PadR family transcriptional regulator PadR
MSASGKRKHNDWIEPGSGDEATAALASARDASGTPVHRGWAHASGRRRWMEPFVLALLAEGSAHGYSIIAQLEDIGISEGSVDVGQVYRTLRDLESAGHVRSAWSDDPTGPRRREYQLTPRGYEELDAWAAVMKERTRLIAEFDARYLEHVTSERRR